MISSIGNLRRRTMGDNVIDICEVVDSLGEGQIHERAGCLETIKVLNNVGIPEGCRKWETH